MCLFFSGRRGVGSAKAVRKQPRSKRSAAFPQPEPEPVKGLICDQVFHIKEDGSRELQYLKLD